MVEGKVRLERPNGDITRILIEKLSTKDQEYVRNWKETPTKKEPPKPTGPRRLAIGDRVDAEHSGDWFPGVVVDIDYRFGHAEVKLDNGKTARHCDEDELRWPGTREAPLLERPVDPAIANLKVVEPNLREVLRVTADDQTIRSVTADPQPSLTAGWKPKAVRLGGIKNMQIETKDFSVACETRPLAALLYADPFADEMPPQIEFVDLSTRRQLMKGPALPHTARVVLSPSGNRIATLSTGDSPSDSKGIMHIWTMSGKEVKHVVGFSPYTGESWPNVDPEWIAWVDDEHLLTTNKQGQTYLWQVNEAKAIYEILVERQAKPALSPGRKHLAVPSVDGIDIFDSRTGKKMANVGSGNMREATLAYSPSGRQIAAVSGEFIDVMDVTTGELTRSFPCEEAHGNRGLSWADDDYLLIDNRSLVHVPLRIVAWKFEISRNNSTTAGGISWMAVNDRLRGSNTIVPMLLPPPGVADAVAKLNESEMLAVRPGAEVTVKAEIRDRSLALAVGKALEDAAREAGMQVTDNAALVLRATMKKGKPERITYRSFGDHFGKGETLSIAPQIYELQLLKDGAKIWQRESVQSSPMHLQLEKGENTRTAINRVMTPTAKNFRGRLPNYVVRPEFQGPLGTSKISGG